MSQYAQTVAPQSQQCIVCPRCHGTNVQVQVVNTKMSTRNRGRGILWTIGRWTLILCTLGLWILVGRSKGKSNTKIKNEAFAVCQGCANKWKVK